MADIRLTNPLDSNFAMINSVMVYPEDFPKEDEGSCDKHVLVEYCPCGGVATEWCKNFAKVDSTLVMTYKSLVKMTQSEIDEILKAENFKLMKDYFRNDYVYFINEDGTPGVFKGIKNDLEQGTEAPYMVCPLHTREAWEAYVAIHGPIVPDVTEPEKTDPYEPEQDETDPGTTLPGIGSDLPGY